MAKDITKTPIKLYPALARALTISSSTYSDDIAALIHRFRKHLEDPGKLTFAVNEILRDLAVNAGFKVGEIETPNKRMSQAQKRRWRNVEIEQREAEQETEVKREARRERDKKRKAAQRAGSDGVDAQGLRETENEGVDFV